MALHSPTAPRTPRCRSHGRRASGATPGAKPPGIGHRNTPRQLSPEQRQFAESHLNLAKQQARRFANRHGIAYDDLLGAAYEGLCKAALGFDASLGHRPSSYIVPKVKGELLHHLRDTGFLLRISHRMRELWMKARRPLALGNSDADIALGLGIELGEWLEVRQACGQRPVPFEEEPPVATSGSW
jgi:DNA-directed RNA polymerase specialized sigma subunit